MEQEVFPACGMMSVARANVINMKNANEVEHPLADSYFYFMFLL